MKIFIGDFPKVIVLMVLAFCLNTFGQTEILLSKSGKPKLIKGEVFIIEKTVSRLPKDFQKLKPITTIYVNEINVPVRQWNNGFPDLPEIYEWFAIEYTADIRIKEEGTYKFRVASDDGAVLFIDDKKVVDNDGVHQFEAASGGIKLTKGDHSLKLQYFQGPRYVAGVQLFVKKDGAKEVIFPGEEIELLPAKTENSNSK